MKWSEMSSRERDVLVATKIFGLTVKPASECSPPTALALWMGAHDYFVLHENGNVLAGVPDYTTSMDDAWQVYQHMAAPYNPKSRYDYEPFLRFSDDLLGIEGPTGWDEELYPSYNYTALIAKWTPERICLAALKACGVEIE